MKMTDILFTKQMKRCSTMTLQSHDNWRKIRVNMGSHIGSHANMKSVVTFFSCPNLFKLSLFLSLNFTYFIADKFIIGRNPLNYYSHNYSITGDTLATQTTSAWKQRKQIELNYQRKGGNVQRDTKRASPLQLSQGPTKLTMQCGRGLTWPGIGLCVLFINSSPPGSQGFTV